MVGKLVLSLIIKPAHADWSVTNPLQAAGISSLGQLVGSKVFPAAVQAGSIMAFFYALWGGLRYISAEGDPKKVESARNMITTAIIGFVILFMAYAVVKILDSILGTGFGT